MYDKTWNYKHHQNDALVNEQTQLKTKQDVLRILKVIQRQKQ